jgi:hypothetical protein
VAILSQLQGTVSYVGQYLLAPWPGGSMEGRVWEGLGEL